MEVGGNIGSSADIASLIGWWQDAGLDVLVDEAPRDWLAQAERPASRVVAPAIPAPSRPAATVESALPETLSAFQAWLAASDGIAMPLTARVAPSGDPASALMVLVDLPEADDTATGRLLSGPAGQLFDKMIAAIGRDRDSLYMAAMAPGRPAGGYVDKASAALFGKLARHHVALAKPRALLLMGEQPSRAFLDLGFVEARGRTHDIKLPGGATTAVATFHPRTLLQHPEQKRRAWEDLQLLMKSLG